MSFTNCEETIKGKRVVAREGAIKYLKSKNIKSNNLSVCDKATFKDISFSGTLEGESANIKYGNIENLNSQYGNIKNFASENGSIDNLIVSGNAEINNIVVKSGVIEDLSVTVLNGKDLNCEKNFTNVNYPLITENPLVNPGYFDSELWDRLVEITLLQQQELEERLRCGRLQEKYIQNLYGCVVCPPNELENCNPVCPPGEGICPCPEGDFVTCPSIPLSIFGIKTLSPVTIIECDNPDANSITQLLSTISYNLDVINVTGNLATRVVTVLVQIGYIDPTIPGEDKFVYRQVDFGNRQFGPTLDTAYGEKYTGTIILPSDIINYIATIPDQTKVAVQMVIFSEEGVEIDVPSSNNLRSKSKFNTFQNTGNVSGAVDAQSITQTVGGQVQWASIYSYYKYNETDIISLKSRFTLMQRPPATQWVMGWRFNGPSSNGGYIGLNMDRNDGPMFLASIFNVGVTATEGESYVTKKTFDDGASGIGYSLRITPENISNFPFNIGEEYEVSINRVNLEGEIATWQFTLQNVTNSTIADLGTIITKEGYTNIKPDGVYQFTEYFGYVTPTIPPIPFSEITWSFPITNDVENSAIWVPWKVRPQNCGACNIEPTLPNGPVKMSFGGCGTCMGVNNCNSGC